jgi:hypothetical protein
VIVHDLDVFGAALRPAEAHTKLIVNSDAVLAGSISFERLEPIARRPQGVLPGCDL